MKNLILSTFFLSFFLPAFAQVNTYFENNPVWHVKKTSYSGWDCSGVIDSRIYTLGGDTLINSLTYKRVMKHGEFSTIDAGCVVSGFYPYSDNVPSFYLRSLDKKMYIYLLNDLQEYLLYDFDLAVGDTLPDSYTCHTNQGEIMVVTSIDSTLTPNGYMKRFSLENGNYVLFEGAGSTGGLDEPIFPLFLSGNNALLCYYMDNTTYFPEYNLGSCAPSVGLTKLEAQEVHVFPNPFINETTIQLSNHAVNATVRLYSINGVMLSKQTFSGDSITLKRGELSSGVYFYSITEDNQITSSGRIVVQ